jgi:manganese/zinc/iron transport system substrate-binding protein
VKYFNHQHYRNNKLFFLLFVLVSCAWLISCTNLNEDREDVPGKFKLLATTTHLADLARQIGGGRLEVDALMGPGVDPHSYRASAQDIARLHEADFVLFHGLSLEGKIARVLKETKRKGKVHFSPCEELPRNQLIFTNDTNQTVDPHLWFAPDLWISCAHALTQKLSEVMPEEKSFFETNLSAFKDSVKSIDRWGKSLLLGIPNNQRILITSHDAFQYFGNHFAIRVIGLQGINTLAEAGLADRTNLVDFIRQHNSPALFVESSVNPKALVEIAKETGAHIGGTLFSDALGTNKQFTKGPDGKIHSTATWQGMMIHNLNVIKKALSER